LWDREDALEQHFVLSVPDTRLGTFKHAVDHGQSPVWIEPSDAVESRVTHDLGSRSDRTVDPNTGSVEVRSSSQSFRIIFLGPKTGTPNTAKACDGDPHFSVMHPSSACSSAARHTTLPATD